MVQADGSKVADVDKPSRLPIPIYVNSGASGGAAYIFSHEDAFYVRRRLRLLGDFCGTLPKHTAQNQYLSLPLTLSYDEASFGISRGFFTPISDVPEDYVKSDPAIVDAFFEDRAADEKRQIDEAVANQLAERERRAKKGKKRQREDDDVVDNEDEDNDIQALQHPGTGDNPTTLSNGQPPRKVMRTSFFNLVSRRIRAAVHAIVPAIVAPPVVEVENEVPQNETKVVDVGEAARQEALLGRLRQQARATTLVITGTKARADEISSAERRRVQLRPPPGVPTERLRNRAAVFADLHDRGYFLSCGAKFGADFLAYAGDPQLFHAALAVIVTRPDEEVSALEVVAIGRLGDSTKKRTVLAFVENRVVQYVGIQWEETLP